MTVIADVLALALRCHQAGDLRQAEHYYRQILQADPGHADALHLLGMIAYQEGRPADALDLIRRALAVNPAHPLYHCNAGLAYQALGRLDAAEAAYRQALALKPDHVAALNNLGAVHKAQGKWAEAEACLRQALHLQPGHVGAHYNLADVIRSQGRYEEAAAGYRHTLQLNPGHVYAHFGLGEALRRLGRFAEAEACYREVVRLQPQFALGHNSLGTALWQQGRFAEAADCYRAALRLDPHLVEAPNNLGCALKDLGRLDEAAACFRQALQMNPGFPPAHRNLGNALKTQGRLDEALSCYDKSLQLDPNYPEGHVGRAEILLLRGDFAGGWAEYEWRWRCPDLPPREFRQPPWDGAPLAGKTILLHAEQGLGDIMQFIRYAARVKQRGGTVLVETPPELLPLLARCRGADRWLARGEPLPDFDCHAPLMSLPHILGTTLATVPADVPYLFADETLVARWRAELRAGPGFKVGINWRGKAAQPLECYRGIPLHHFAPLARLPGVRLYSLQKGPGQEELRAAAQHFPITDLGGRLDEAAGAFMDTAAVMKGLDLVITSDTSIAHLAGGLGVPVWVGLWSPPEWRWLLDRADSPWYPTLRLFRQETPGDWGGVLARRAGELAGRRW
jgi:tetratricopeptide (TPR) repeat protein